MRTDQSDADSGGGGQVARMILGTHLNELLAFVASRVPDAWPPELIPSAPVSIVGGMTAGTSMTAVFRYAPSVEQPLAEFCALLERNGWTPARTMMSGGFDSTRIAMFCRDGVFANVLRASSDPTDTSIVVSLAPSQGWPCSEDKAMRMPGVASLRPRVRAARNARQNWQLSRALRVANVMRCDID